MFIVPTTTELGYRLAAIMAGMATVVANHVAGLRAISSALVPMLSLVTWRLGRIAQRLDRLVLRWHAGSLPQPRPARASRAGAEPRPRIAVPNSHAWPIRHVQPTAQYIAQVEHFLAHPQLRALVAAAPQTGRLLRPLCRMLAIAPPDWLRLPKRQRVSFSPPALGRGEPEGGSSSVVLSQKQPPGTPDRPLPPYIRAAVRAWKRRGE